VYDVAACISALYHVPPDVMQMPSVVLATDYALPSASIKAVDDTACSVAFRDNRGSIPYMASGYSIDSDT